MKLRYRITALVIAMAVVLLYGIEFYAHRVNQMIYRENASHLQESYVQISKTLTLFIQRQVYIRILLTAFPKDMLC